jgi:uncharacterized integral membrane protein
MQIFLFIALILMGVTIIFAVQNTATTMVRFLTWETEGSLALVLIVSVAVGALISFFFSLPTLVRDKWTVRSQRKKINEMETELSDQNARLKDSENRIAEYDQSKHDGEKSVDEIVLEEEQYGELSSKIEEQSDHTDEEG